MNGERYRCERAGPAHTAGLLALFEGSGSGCFCNYWYFAGDKNAWLQRCYLEPDQNRAALLARLAAPELCGVVGRLMESDSSGPAGTERGAVCGWLGLGRAPLLSRLYDQRVYRRLPCFEGAPSLRETVYAVTCFYVSEPERGRGLSRALLQSAIALVQAAGGTAIEAFPRAAPVGEKLRPDEVWMGPQTLLQGLGFVPVSDFRPYPVLRLHLD